MILTISSPLSFCILSLNSFLWAISIYLLGFYLVVLLKFWKLIYSKIRWPFIISELPFRMTTTVEEARVASLMWCVLVLLGLCFVCCFCSSVLKEVWKKIIWGLVWPLLSGVVISLILSIYCQSWSSATLDILNERKFEDCLLFASSNLKTRFLLTWRVLHVVSSGESPKLVFLQDDVHIYILEDKPYFARVG